MADKQSSSSLSGVMDASNTQKNDVSNASGFSQNQEWDDDEGEEDPEEDFMSGDDTAGDAGINEDPHDVPLRPQINPNHSNRTTDDQRRQPLAQPGGRNTTESSSVAASTSSKQQNDMLKRFADEQIQKAKFMSAAKGGECASNFTPKQLATPNPVPTSISQLSSVRGGGLPSGSNLEDFVNQQLQKAKLHKVR